mmetsp:Transcript_30660/g.76283  ORF Transcript_30660/g.76283 Transcript_30660/m.76283 type:complete len:357 (+) Transcript_30660:179-1249(+)
MRACVCVARVACAAKVARVAPPKWRVCRKSGACVAKVFSFPFLFYLVGCGCIYASGTLSFCLHPASGHLKVSSCICRVIFSFFLHLGHLILNVLRALPGTAAAVVAAEAGEAAEAARAKAEARRRREIERRMRPRTHEDFEILYNELEAWRLLETSKINEASLPPDVKQATLKQLLHKETKLLQTIDRLKIAANHENRDVRIAKTLADMANAKRWENADGSLVEVHTPFTTRAKELMQLYNGLRLPLLTTDERLDVLLHVKWTVKEFDCNLTREIVELIDREADLLNRGRDPKSMEGLRRRIANLFLHFVETPEFNPEAGRYTVSSVLAESEAQMLAMTMAPPSLAPSRESVAVQV